MSKRQRNAQWWRLYLLAAVMAGLLFLEVKARLSQAGHEALEVGIVLVGYGMIWLWLGNNRTAMAEEARQRLPREAGRPQRTTPALGEARQSDEAQHKETLDYRYTTALAAQSARQNGGGSSNISEPSSRQFGRTS